MVSTKIIEPAVRLKEVIFSVKIKSHTCKYRERECKKDDKAGGNPDDIEYRQYLRKNAYGSEMYPVSKGPKVNGRAGPNDNRNPKRRR